MITQLIDADTSWIIQTGIGIAPTAPASSSIVLLPSKHPAWLLRTSGTADPAMKLYPGVLFAPGASDVAIGTPVWPNTGHAAISQTDIPGADFLSNGHAREIDVKYVFLINGVKWMANCSTQWILATGEIDIDSGATPGWHDSTIRMKPMIAGKKHHIRIEHAWNLAVSPPTFSVVSYACNGIVGLVPPAQQNVPMEVTNWEGPAAGSGIQGLAYRQQQLGIQPAGGPTSVIMENIKHLYW